MLLCVILELLELLQEQTLFWLEGWLTIAFHPLGCRRMVETSGGVVVACVGTEAGRTEGESDWFGGVSEHHRLGIDAWAAWLDNRGTLSSAVEMNVSLASVGYGEAQKPSPITS